MPGNAALVVPDATVYDTLFATLTPQEAGRVAIVDGSTGTELTFGELRDRVDAFAGALAALGIAPGDVVGLLADFVRAELAHAQAGETVAPDAIYTANRNRYLATVKAQLPLREELGSYVNDQSGPAMPVVTNWDFRRLQRALALCEQIRGGSQLVVAFGYLLDGGSGKEVPLDGYEAEAFNKMITTALARQDVQQANALYQALLSYQVMNWYVYNDAVQDSIARYRRFLDDHALDRVAHAQALESRLRKLNPHEYSQEYKHYLERTLRFLHVGPTQPTSGSAKNGNAHD